MSSDEVLHIQGVGKAFCLYASEWHRIARWFGVPIKPKECRNVLSDISLTVGRGEAVAVVGQNGSGKSTLLKIVADTLKPSSGYIEKHGRVSAILELGMGFHPDLTPRQNVYHAAGLMGFSFEMIKERMDWIEDFCEIGDYFDRPLRTLSSGMQMRVAFAVATAWRPDLLIIDEALSVGDIYFQHKSFDRIKTFQKEGTALLLVSHDRAAVQALCNRALLLEKGQLILDGEPEKVMDYYNALIAEKEQGSESIEQHIGAGGKVQTVSGSRHVALSSLRLLNESAYPAEVHFVGKNAILEIVIETREAVDELVVGYMIKDRLGQTIYGTNTHFLGHTLRHIPGGQRLCFRFYFTLNLGPGSYAVTVAAHEGADHLKRNHLWIDNATIFEVHNGGVEEFVGVAWLPPRVEIMGEGDET